MERQLALLEERPDWRIDDATRAVGRLGLAAARASLQEARRRAAAERDAARADRHHLARPAA